MIRQSPQKCLKRIEEHVPVEFRIEGDGIRCETREVVYEAICVVGLFVVVRCIRQLVLMHV